MMKSVHVIFAAALLAANTALAAVFPTDVKLEQGIAAGAADAAHNTVRWLGLPYGQAERWGLPQPPAKSSATLDCTAPAPANLQYAGGRVTGEENVLTLDIYRPDTGEENLPVLVFYHGGNNQTSSSRMWMGDKFAAAANAVFVSVQYRLGVLGFNNLDALHNGNKKNDSGNYGFLDQAQSLDWLHKNIRAFGGDPDNITVSGFSAGGRDVMAMLISPAFKGKFDKAISFSGGLTVAGYDRSRKIIAENLAPLAVEDGVKSNAKEAAGWLLDGDKKETAAYLRGLDGSRLAPVMAGALIRMDSFPHLYGDGAVLPEEGFAVRKYNSVPLLLLASTDEFSSFAARDPYFKNRLQDIFTDERTRSQFAFANKYGSRFYCYFNGQQTAETIYGNYKDDIYVCCFNYAHDPAVAGEKYALRNGAFHGVFLPFLTDQPLPYTRGTDIFSTPGAEELSDIFIASIASFMRTGSPNNGSLPFVWEKWTPENRAEAVFDADREKALVSLRYDGTSYGAVMEEMEADTSLPAGDKDYIIRNVLNGRWFSGGIDEKYRK